MSSFEFAPEQNIPATSSRTSISKPQRVLACVSCQQRKIKCDRKFPCTNCIKSKAQCISQATLPTRQRRRRFPERELLDRLRHYEDLLRQNNIDFQPVEKDGSGKDVQQPRAEAGRADLSPGHQLTGSTFVPDGSSSPSTTGKSEITYKAKSLWHAMNQKYEDPDYDSSDSSDHEVREVAVKAAWNEYQSNDHLLFSSHKTTADISTLHPEQIQIFRLWQIYLDNVNPLLKVTHIPSLQGRIIDAASNVANIKPNLVALMFSIYCVAVMSLSEEDCSTMFGVPRDDLLSRYQSGCQHALWNCGFLRSSDRECLTALYLYLISIRTITDPQSLSSLLGVAMRFAQRMGLHSEATYDKCSILEAEMRRRLWWSLVLFDTRICELAVYRSMLLIPTWDCRTPLNVNDFDLQPEMKNPPEIREQSTEALFIVVRSEMGDFVRHSTFHLDFINPALKAIAKDVHPGPLPEGGELVTLENMIEEKHLKFCNPENPLHYMTMWMARGHLAKYRLLEAFSKHTPSLSASQTDAQRDTVLSHALTTLICDTNLLTSPLTKGYLWLTQLYFPLPAYLHIVQELRRRPACKLAEKTWEVLSDHFDARDMPQSPKDGPLFKMLAKILLQAWEGREALFTESQQSLQPPRIVGNIQRKLAAMTPDVQSVDIGLASNTMAMNLDDFSMSLPMHFGGQAALYGAGGEGGEGLGLSHGQQPASDVDVNQLEWNAMDWNPMYARNW